MAMDCQWQADGSGFICCTCGYRTAAKVRRNCGKCSGCTQPALPSLVKQAWNYAASTAFWATNGAQTVTDDQYHERKAICEGCPRLHRMDDGGLRCAECGCWIAIKAARLTTPGQSDCPLGKWEPLSPLS